MCVCVCVHARTRLCVLFCPIVLSGLRRSEDGWVFEDPVTETIAPGYFEVIEKPMDFCTVEKKLEGSHYKTKQEVGVLNSTRLVQHYHCVEH